MFNNIKTIALFCPLQVEFKLARETTRSMYGWMDGRMDCAILVQRWYFWVFSPAGVYILIGAGSLVMLVGFFGCCGAVRESQCLLGSVSAYKQIHCIYYYVIFSPHLWFLLQFFACLLIIFGAEVAAGVFGFLNKEKVHWLPHHSIPVLCRVESRWHCVIQTAHRL